MANGQDDGPEFVRITNREVWLRLGDIDKTLFDFKVNVNRVLDDNEDLRKRVRSLELKFYSILAGLITALAGALWLGGKL